MNAHFKTSSIGNGERIFFYLFSLTRFIHSFIHCGNVFKRIHIETPDTFQLSTDHNKKELCLALWAIQWAVGYSNVSYWAVSSINKCIHMQLTRYRWIIMIVNRWYGFFSVNKVCCSSFGNCTMRACKYEWKERHNKRKFNSFLEYIIVIGFVLGK